MSTQRKRPAIRDLFYGALDVQPVNYDWPGERIGEDWDFWSADTCDQCGALLVGQGESIQHRDVDSDSACEGYLSLSPPMMSYWYPLPLDDKEDAARKIAHLPLCVVEVDGTTGLALTGGGMDLSWEICEAFMWLGYLPPLHFADVAAMCGRGTSPRDRWILAACLKTCAASAERAKRTAQRIRVTRAWGRKYAAEQKRKVG